MRAGMEFLMCFPSSALFNQYGSPGGRGDFRFALSDVQSSYLTRSIL